MKKLSILLLVFAAFIVSNETHAQVLKTKLQVTVRNDLGNLVEGATVSLYKTESDYDSEENAVQTGTTDAKGRIIFKELDPIAYFMNVRKGDLTNIGRGVKTTKLIVKKKNIVDVIIE